MKFGEVWEISTDDGPIVVMIVAPSPVRELVDYGISNAVTLSGQTTFVGGAGYPAGVYGPGAIGPVHEKFGRLVDDPST